MAEFSVKNLIFFMQMRPSPSIPTSRVSVLPKSSTSLRVQNSSDLPLQSAIATTSQNLPLDEKDTQTHDSALDFFKSRGFDDTHIEELIGKRPNLLKSSVDRIVSPKLEYLAAYGFSDTDLYDLVFNNKFITSRSFSKQIEPSINFLTKILVTPDRVIKAVRRNRWLLTSDLEASLRPNIDLMVNEGVAADDIADFLVVKPTRMVASSDRMALAIKTVKNDLGVDPADGRRFLYCVTTMAYVNPSLWEKKVQVFTSFGWSDQEIWSLFIRFPTCFANSESRLRYSLDFYTNVVDLKREALIDNPILLLYAIDTRVRPRYDVLQLLLSEKLIPEDVKFNKIFILTEDRFLENYVSKYLDQVPSLLEIYENDRID